MDSKIYHSVNSPCPTEQIMFSTKTWTLGSQAGGRSSMTSWERNYDQYWQVESGCIQWFSREIIQEESAPEKTVVYIVGKIKK